jgi:hypothetical protein
MRVLSLLMWWGGIFMLALLLWRIVVVRLLVCFPLFSAYIGGVLAKSVVLLFFQPVTSRAYWFGYWISEFVTAALSFGIAWEGYTEALAAYPGVRRMARSLLSLLFAVVAANAAVGLWGSRHFDLTFAIGEFERDLRVLQVLSLLALAALVVHYAIPAGRNVLFMVIGYGMYLGFRVATLNALFELPVVYRPWLSLLLQCAWNGAVLIWIVGMWSPAPTRSPDAPRECDYERSSQQTIRALVQIRDYLVHSWRS